MLLAVAEAWREQRDEVARSSAKLVEHIRAGARSAAVARAARPTSCSTTRSANLRAGFDPTWGGWGRAPKFPPAPVLEFLLRRGEERDDAPHARRDGAGGMYDLVGGGFHRYSVDERWLVPHFEKMLYDNALLASVYLHAARRFGDERYRAIADRTLDYVLRELALDGGGFASAQDADTNGVEGLTFTWAPGEGAPEELFEPFEDGRFVAARRARRRDARAAARAARGAAAAAARRQGDRLVERARCSPRSRRAAASRPARARSPSSCSARSRRPTAACTAPGATASPRAPATSRTTPTSPTG